MTPDAVAEKLGGSKVHRTEVRSELDLARAIHEGLPTRAVEEVLEAELLKPDELYQLVGPRRTLAHRKQQRQALSPEQSDREKASRWMRKPNRALGGTRPLDLLESDVGAGMVERVLGRINHGIFS